MISTKYEQRFPQATTHCGDQSRTVSRSYAGVEAFMRVSLKEKSKFLRNRQEEPSFVDFTKIET